jgi:hypothetical protein
MLRCCSHQPGAGATTLHCCSKLWLDSRESRVAWPVAARHSRGSRSRRGSNSAFPGAGSNYGDPLRRDISQRLLLPVWPGAASGAWATFSTVHRWTSMGKRAARQQAFCCSPVTLRWTALRRCCYPEECASLHVPNPLCARDYGSGEVPMVGPGHPSRLLNVSIPPFAESKHEYGVILEI